MTRAGVDMTPKLAIWERPVKTILDFFQLDKVCIIGALLGGYLAPRAAAFDKRITKLPKMC